MAGGVLNSLYDKTSADVNGTAVINGNVSMTISGGIFDSAAWIYGGCVATNKAKGSLSSTINGDVVVTVDCGSKAIQLSHLVVGSYGWGEINYVRDAEDPTVIVGGGNTKLVFKGSGANLSFADNGELWGGCSGDNVSPVTGKCAGVDEYDDGCLVEGDRLLSFEGFTGDLNCAKIRDFSSFQMKDSKVGLTKETVDMSGIANWTFERTANYNWAGAMLSGNFKNDFAGDTLNLNGFLSAVSGVTLITDLNSGDDYDPFNGLANLSKVFLNGNDVGTLTKTWTDETETQLKSLSWSAGSSESASWLAGSLDLNTDNNNGMVMQLTLA